MVLVYPRHNFSALDLLKTSILYFSHKLSFTILILKLNLRCLNYSPWHRVVKCNLACNLGFIFLVLPIIPISYEYIVPNKIIAYNTATSPQKCQKVLN